MPGNSLKACMACTNLTGPASAKGGGPNKNSWIHQTKDSHFMGPMLSNRIGVDIPYRNYTSFLGTLAAQKICDKHTCNTYGIFEVICRNDCNILRYFLIFPHFKPVYVRLLSAKIDETNRKHKACFSTSKGSAPLGNSPT